MLPPVAVATTVVAVLEMVDEAGLDVAMVAAVKLGPSLDQNPSVNYARRPVTWSHAVGSALIATTLVRRKW
jgi:hypothetical protein